MSGWDRQVSSGLAGGVKAARANRSWVKLKLTLYRRLVDLLVDADGASALRGSLGRCWRFR
eukprot:1132900-Prymnesium_polylepis.1